MKTIGMIGGTSWHSTVHYYRIINETVNREMGDHHAARIIMSSIDFQDIFGRPDWDKLGRMFTAEAKRLEAAGADFFIVCSNGMHHLAEDLRKAVGIPFLSIIDCVAEEIKRREFTRVGLLGTKGTMRDTFYHDALAAHGIETLTPDKEGRAEISRIIFDELTLGTFADESRAIYARIIEQLSNEGAEGVVLGCTEIPILIQQEHTTVPLLDTLAIHAEAAARMALAD